MRDGLLFLHIIGAAGWIGGGLYAWYTQNKIARDSAAARPTLPLLTKASGAYFGAVSGLTLLSGIALVWTQDPWAWNDTFVLIGIGVFIFSAVWQPLVSQKVGGRLLTAVEEGRDPSAELTAGNRTTVLEVLVLLVALWAMIAKLGV